MGAVKNLSMTEYTDHLQSQFKYTFEDKKYSVLMEYIDVNGNPQVIPRLSPSGVRWEFNSKEVVEAFIEDLNKNKTFPAVVYELKLYPDNNDPKYWIQYDQEKNPIHSKPLKWYIENFE